MRTITRMSPSGLAETRSMVAWLTNAMGQMTEPRTESDSKDPNTFETTWNLVSRDGSFTGYAQLSQTCEGTVKVLVRDRSTKPVCDDRAFVEPPRRDGTSTVTDPSDHGELRRAMERWIGYLDAIEAVDASFMEARKADVGRAGLLKTRSISTNTRAAIVNPPSAHHRMLLNNEPCTYEEDRRIEDAIDGRWGDVVEIGMTTSSGCRTWTIVRPDSFFVMGDPDPMEILRLHKNLLEAPASEI